MQSVIASNKDILVIQKGIGNKVTLEEWQKDEVVFSKTYKTLVPKEMEACLAKKQEYKDKFK